MEGAVLEFVIVVGPQQGTLSGSGTEWVYTPNLDYVGPDRFEFVVSDGQSSSSPAEVLLMVLGPTDEPPTSSTLVAGDDNYLLESGLPLIVAASGLLENDEYPEPPESVFIELVEPPQFGSLDYLHDDGAFQYTPAAGYAGEDSFRYRLTGNDGYSNTATVSLLIPGGANLLEIANALSDEGQQYVYLGEAAEDFLGAFTVANYNDTDGDGYPDGFEDTVEKTANNRDEIDLMALKILRPEEGVKVTVTLPVELLAWRHSTKGERVPLHGEELDTFVVGGSEDDVAFGADGTVVVYLEAVVTVLRAEVKAKAQLISGALVRDTVKASGIWVESRAVEAGTKDHADVLGADPWSRANNNFRNWLIAHAGTGVRPVATDDQWHNVIWFAWQVTPASAQNGVNYHLPNGILGPTLWSPVKFDATRRVTVKMWENLGTENAPVWTLLGAPFTKNASATDVELPNDDKGSSDEYDEPDITGLMLNRDEPSLLEFVINTTVVAQTQYANFDDFIRVTFHGQDPTELGAVEVGNGITEEKRIGSRASYLIPWHSIHETVRGGLGMVRGAAKNNRIAPGKPDIPDSPK